MQLTDQAPFSYRDALPSFDDAGPRTVMDARCGICAKGARWIARNDADQAFRIIPMQSDLGAALLTHYGLDPEDPTSWLFLENGRAYTSLDAVIRVANRLGGPWRLLSALRLVPRPVQDAAYGLLARNRYRLFGTADLCNLPDPAIQARLLS
ncbi:MAG: DCC1-like thiol-disulfide oxidoreductase family protein [Pseudomonadota bacterium]